MIGWEINWTLTQRSGVRWCLMLENANATIDLATEDVKDRKQVQSQRDFEPLLDTEEAARLLRMHPRTLRTKARRGSIPAVQVGKRWRFRASTLDRWLGKLAS
jgi:excisionase family DNA binding protein